MDSTTTEHRERSADYEVVIVGAGQAGLAIGYLLGRQGRRIVILDRASSVGAAWRERWESLTLFTPRCYDSLPGLPFPGDPEGYPGRDEVIDYLERYAATFELPIEVSSEVRRVSTEDGRYVLDLDGRTTHRGAGRRRHRPVPGAVRARARSPARARRRAPAQHGLPEPGRRARGEGARRRRREHGLPDREGALGDTRSAPVDRVPPDAAAATVPRPRPLLVADDVPALPDDRRVAARPAAAAPRHAHRFEPARAPPSVRGSSSGRGRSTRPVAPSASRTGPSSKSTR